MRSTGDVAGIACVPPGRSARKCPQLALWVRATLICTVSGFHHGFIAVVRGDGHSPRRSGPPPDFLEYGVETGRSSGSRWRERTRRFHPAGGGAGPSVEEPDGVMLIR